jgi:hypothetical protein
VTVDTFLRLYVYGLTGMVAAWALYVGILVARLAWRRLGHGKESSRGRSSVPGVRASEVAGAPLRARHGQRVDA